MSLFKNNIFSETNRKIKQDLPDFVRKAVFKLLPIFLISSVFEIIGLAIIIPAINILIDQEIVKSAPALFWLYNSLNFSSNVSFVLFILFAICIIFIIKNALLYFIYKYQTKVGFDLASRLAVGKYNSYLNMPYRFFSENNTAILLRNITQLPIDIVIYSILPFVGLINEIFLILIILSAITLYNPLLFFATAIFVIPFLFLYNKTYRSKLKRISTERDKESSKVYQIGLQSIEGFREIKIFDKLNFFRPVFQRSLESYAKISSDGYLMNIFSPKIVETVAIMCLVNIFLFGYLLGNNITVLTQFMAIFAISSYRIIPSINKIILYSNYIKSSAYTFQYFSKKDDVATEQHSEKNKEEALQPLTFNKNVEIRGLSFKFADAEENILKNLRLNVTKGQTIGIVGPSGSGKSTLLNILLRLYVEDEGGIYVDGVKIERNNISNWYKLVSYVPQNMILLDGTIKENIAFGIHPEDINTILLEKVIARSQLKEFIDKLPEGINSQIGENGIKISGGQKQRIAIARALYHGGEILIFDEATSALDSETEEMLTEAIHSISHQDLTIIIVAHRVQTLKYCDAIYKIENGALNERLTYSQIAG